MVTILDIAKLANVSHTTVSRALNGSPLIKEKTKEKILKIVEELNYVPDLNAKNLVMQKTNVIGLFFTSIKHGTTPSFFIDVVKGVNAIIHQEHSLSVRGIDDYQNYLSIHKKRFDGIILMSQSDSDAYFIDHVLKSNIPLVVLNREVKNLQVMNILSNDREGAYQATNYLIEQGHQKIGLIEGIKGYKSSVERREGYVKALSDHKIPVDERYILPGNYDIQSGHAGMEAFLQLEDPPTAIFCSNDEMALGAMNTAYSKGLKIPSDISIVGFDGIVSTRYTSPKLTTVRRPIEEISKLGAQELLKLLDKNIKQEKKIFLETELIIQDSVKNISE